MQSEETWMELHVLQRHGWSIAALAREFGLNWRTARRYATVDEAPRYRPRARPAELSAAQLAHVERRLAACPDLRATVLLRELVDEYGYPGSYASLRRRVALLRPATTAEPVLRFETGPGIQTQGDWADVGAWPLGDGTADLFAFVAILGCSRMVGLRFATDKTRPTTLPLDRPLRRRPRRGDRGVPDRPGHGAHGGIPGRRRPDLRPRVARHRGPARHPPPGLPAVPGQDQGQGGAGHPGGQGGLPRLAHRAGAAGAPDARLVRRGCPALGGRGPRGEASTGRPGGSSARPGPRSGRSCCPSAAV